MSWWNFRKAEHMKGPYPCGQKSFSCTFKKRNLVKDSVYSGEVHSAGRIAWDLSVCKYGKKMVVDLEATTKDSSKVVNRDWQVETDYVIRIRNTSHVFKSSHVFSKKDEWISHSVPLDSLDDVIVVDVEIGVKAMDLQVRDVEFSQPTDSSDLVLISGSRLFHVESDKLAAESTLFREHVEKRNQSVELRIDDNVDAHDFLKLLRYIYKYPTVITEQNICRLFAMGKIFGVERLLNDCKQYLLEEELPPAEAVWFADYFEMDDVVKTLLDRAETLEDVKNASRHYKQLSHKTLEEVLSTLHCKSFECAEPSEIQYSASESVV